MNEPTELEKRLAAQAQAEAEEQQLQGLLKEQTKALYSMNCFEVLPGPGGHPLAARVPGGWIFYMRSGGASLRAGGESEVVGNPIMIPTFVPYHEEFKPPKAADAAAISQGLGL